MKKCDSIVKDVNDSTTRGSDYTDIEMVNKEGERCFNCAQIFEENAFILAAYGLLFCSIDCVREKFPDADLNDVEIILASDIGVE